MRVDPAGDSSATNQAAGPLVTAPNQRMVYVSSGTSKEPRLKTVRVKIGVDDGAESEILDGLREGDAVVTAALSAAAQAMRQHGPPPQ